MYEQKIGQERTLDKLEYWKERALQAEKKNESYQYLAIAAQDAIDTFPTVTLRTLRGFITKMNAMTEALKQVL